MTDNPNSKKNLSLTSNSAREFLPWLAILPVVILTALQLFHQDRIWWCKFGDYAPWSSDAWGKHNSQHLLDPYSFTHILHGVLYFWLVSLIFRRMPFAWRFFTTILVECAWEILENTNTIIEHYRAATLALDYYGDSVANSLGDIFCCGVGFWLAYKLKFWRSLVLFLLIEIILLVWIRDSLLLNIIMLIHPLGAVKAWQSQ
jgi:Protein of unknown function (DUF2585)